MLEGPHPSNTESIRDRLAREQENHASSLDAKRAWYRQQAEWIGPTVVSAVRLALSPSYPHPDSMLDCAVREARIAAHFALMGGI